MPCQKSLMRAFLRGGQQFVLTICATDIARARPANNSVPARASVGRAVLMGVSVLAVGAELGLHVDVRIGDLVVRAAVAYDQKQHIFARAIDKAMGLAGAGRESRARARAEQL